MGHRSDYWIKLFPSMKDKRELDNLIKRCSHITLDELEEQFDKSINEIITYEFLEKSGNKEFEASLDKCLEKVKEKSRWVFYYKPLFLYYLEGLYELINSTSIIKEKESLFCNVLLGISEILHQISFRVIISEVNTLREEKRLKGDSSKERGAYYSNVLLKDKEYICDVYNRYPELTRLLNIFVKNEVDYISKILEETNSEFINLCNEFNIETNDKLISLELSAGDTHNGGKTVAILHFASGEKLIYKPRNLEIDEGYNKFLEYINNQGIDDFYNLEGVKVYSNKDKTAGWVKFINYEECKDEEEVKRFYNRIGEILCLLYLFHSTDFHYENLIAKGEMPVLIDMETILNPMIYDSIYDKSAETKVNMFINDSIEKSGLVPRKTMNKNNKLVDIGGLSASENQESRLKALCIEGYDTDEVRLVRKFVEIKPKDNNPKLNGEIIKSENYVDEIKFGFINLYRWIINNKAEVKNKIIECFENKYCRIVPRGTSIYDQVIMTSYHPQLLSNSIDRKVYLHRIGLQLNGVLEKIVYDEIMQMENGDIPYFSVNTSNTNFYSGTPSVINDMYEKPILEMLNDNLDMFNEWNLEKQIAILNVAYYGGLTESVNYVTGIDFNRDSKKSEFSSKEALNLVNNIADYILRKSIKGEGANGSELSWLGVKNADFCNEVVISAPVTSDLYDGNSGIALFFAYLAKLTNNEKYKKAAYETINPVMSYLSSDKKKGIGFFNGTSGELFSLFNIGMIFEDKKLIDFVYEKLSLLEELIVESESVDIIGGHAGVISPLIYIYKNTDRKNIKDKIKEMLHLSFEKIKGKFDGEKITLEEEEYLGFAHGSTGLTAALYTYYSLTKDEEALELVKKTLAYERSCYNDEKESLPREKGKDVYPSSWCHGLSGHLSSRVALKKYGYNDELIDKEISAAIKNIINRGLNHNFCLCHGDLGNLLELFEAANILGDKVLREQVVNVVINYALKVEKENVIENIFKFEENNGTMTGIAGIGYVILKILYPEIVVNILTL